LLRNSLAKSSPIIPFAPNIVCIINSCLNEGFLKPDAKVLIIYHKLLERIYF
jgi:hypothetical protein